MKVRIEIHLSSTEAKFITMLASKQGRSRKNFCEREMRKIIQLSPYFTLALHHQPATEIIDKQFKEIKKVDLS